MSKATRTTTTLDSLAENVDKNTRARYEAQKAQGVVNPIVLASLLGVRPQMIYNYLAKGKFTDMTAVGTNSTQKKVIDISEANTFALGYTERKVAREEAAKAKIEAELAGETVEA